MTRPPWTAPVSAGTDGAGGAACAAPPIAAPAGAPPAARRLRRESRLSSAMSLAVSPDCRDGAEAPQPGPGAIAGRPAHSVNATGFRAVSAQERGAQTRHLRFAGGEAPGDCLRRGGCLRRVEAEADRHARSPRHENPPRLVPAGDEQVEAIRQDRLGDHADRRTVQGDVPNGTVEFRQEGGDAQSAAEADTTTGGAAALDHDG